MTYEHHLAQALRDHLRERGVRVLTTVVPPTWTSACDWLKAEALSRLRWENEENARNKFLKAVK